MRCAFAFAMLVSVVCWRPTSDAAEKAKPIRVGKPAGDTSSQQPSVFDLPKIQVQFVRLQAALLALGEEIGWRGFYLPRLQKRRSALGASIVVGVAWGLWHIPTQILAFRQYGLMVVLANVLVTHILGVTAQSIVMTWVHNNARQSLLLMILFHYGITATTLFLFQPNMPVMQGLRHWLIYAAFYWLAALIVIATSGPKRLMRESRSAQET